uniref:Putative secreted protein n=1 Tax=Ixodes scapularis TaxID=6945 RepID=A0A4D5RYF0_IXOSC
MGLFSGLGCLFRALVNVTLCVCFTCVSICSASKCWPVGSVKANSCEPLPAFSLVFITPLLGVRKGVFPRARAWPGHLLVYHDSRLPIAVFFVREFFFFFRFAFV